MPFSNPEDRNAYMREYRRRPRTPLRPRARVPEYLPEPRAMAPARVLARSPVAPLRPLGCCPYCSGSERSSAGTICNYCRPQVSVISPVRVPQSFVQGDDFSPLGVWVVVAGVVGVIGVVLFWLWRRSSSGGAARLVESTPPRAWVHWMEGVQL